MLICPLFVLTVLTALFALFSLFALSELTALFALAWRFEPTMVVVLLVLMLILLATRLIDEMSELVGDLQADRKYYQTNIALAASSLAAKTKQAKLILLEANIEQRLKVSMDAYVVNMYNDFSNLGYVAPLYLSLHLQITRLFCVVF
jgi:hypothetical protein